ncbi:MAG: phosphoenolpyruvate mutase [Acidobacteriota bacterium]|nr:phosphoenolpyruvate mutase [Acidobacteriota bacterium]
MTPATMLRELFARPGVIRLIGAHNPLGAKLAEKAGFDGVWSSGFEISTSHGVPDANILTMTDFLQAGQSMASSVPIPVVADCDTGFGNSNNVIHMVRLFEQAGVAAVCIEDKLFPKVNSFIPGRQELATIAEFVGKVMAAKNAQRSKEFMVIARVEALIAGWGMEEAMKRAQAYANAGADAILIHSKAKTPHEIAEFAKGWNGKAPLVVVPTTYNSVTIKDLSDLGIKMAIYANQGLRAGIQAMLDVYQKILEDGSTSGIESRIAPMETLFELQGMPQYKKDEQSFSRTAKIHARAIIPAAGDHLNEYSMEVISSDIPMTMLDVSGKTLLRRQSEAMNLAGIQNITVVGGYHREKIEAEGVNLAENADWQTTGEMTTLLAGEGDASFDGKTIVAYSDILFNSEIVEKLLKSNEDAVLVVDPSFNLKGYGPDRKIDLVEIRDNDTPAGDRPRRTLNPTACRPALRIGKALSRQEAGYEFAGLAAFSPRGWRQLRQTYTAAMEHRNSAPFHDARSVESASLTDVLQEMINQGQQVHCLEVSSGWMEIHSFDDYKRACQVVAK